MECSGSASSARCSDTPPSESRPRTESREPLGTFSFFRSSVGILDLHVYSLSGLRGDFRLNLAPSTPLKRGPKLADIFHALRANTLSSRAKQAALPRTGSIR